MDQSCIVSFFSTLKMKSFITANSNLLIMCKNSVETKRLARSYYSSMAFASSIKNPRKVSLLCSSKCVMFIRFVKNVPPISNKHPFTFKRPRLYEHPNPHFHKFRQKHHLPKKRGRDPQEQNSRCPKSGLRYHIGSSYGQHGACWSNSS